MMNVGEKILFKVRDGRGRPAIGEIVKKQGMFIQVRTKSNELKFVKASMVTNPYSFKPYMTKARRAAQVA